MELLYRCWLEKPELIMAEFAHTAKYTGDIAPSRLKRLKDHENDLEAQLAREIEIWGNWERVLADTGNLEYHRVPERIGDQLFQLAGGLENSIIANVMFIS